jgi:hypothetical protein
VSSSIPDPIPDDATPEQLRHYVNYWRMEAKGYAFRWNLAMQYGDNLKAENARLRKAGDALSYALQTCKYSPEEIAHYSDAWTEAKK